VTLRYVALGDSYTIGTSVEADARWPDQLVRRLGPPPVLDLVANLAVNGYTSADLIREELPPIPGLVPGFVSVLIGVNDVVQRVPPERYEANCTLILDRLTGLVGPDRIVCVEIPDYSYTPAGSDYGDPDVQRAAIAVANTIMARLTAARGIAFVDGIFEGSAAVASDRSLVAADGLHPSGAEYARWVDRILPVVEALLP
jgi:lysophospholipase L1-like esterase